MTEPLLSVRGLKVGFRHQRRTDWIVRGVDFEIRAAERVALVGRSGSGKSLLALSLLRLLPLNAVAEGALFFQGTDLHRVSPQRMASFRGSGITMTFQDAPAALHPVRTVGEQLEETLRLRQSLPPANARAAALELLRQLEISDPEARARSYPHQLSGGMCQRVMLALALACQPRLLVADEPTSGLDPTIQIQILKLLRESQERSGFSLLLISHDRRLVERLTHRSLRLEEGYLTEESRQGLD